MRKMTSVSLSRCLVKCVQTFTIVILLTTFVPHIRAIPTKNPDLDDWDNFFNDKGALPDAAYKPSVISSEIRDAANKNVANNQPSDPSESNPHESETYDHLSAIGSNVPRTEDPISQIPSSIPTEPTEMFSPLGSELPSVSGSSYETYGSDKYTPSASSDASVNVMFRVQQSGTDFNRNTFASTITTVLNIDPSQFHIDFVKLTDAIDETNVHCNLLSGPSGTAITISNTIGDAVESGEKGLVQLKIVYYITYEGDVIYFEYGPSESNAIESPSLSSTRVAPTISPRPSASQTDPTIHTIEMILLCRLTLFNETKFIQVVSYVNNISPGRIKIKKITELNQDAPSIDKYKAENKTSVVYDVLHEQYASSTKLCSGIMATVKKCDKGYAEINLLKAKLDDGEYVDYETQVDPPKQSDQSGYSASVIAGAAVTVTGSVGILAAAGVYGYRKGHLARLRNMRLWGKPDTPSVGDDASQGKSIEMSNL